MPPGEHISTLITKPKPGFVETPQVVELTQRALSYVRAGFAVHFCGPAGSGKTTLALHLARLIGRPTLLIFGDEELNTSDLVGGQFGYSRRRVIDNFIHSVLKTEEDLSQRWVDSRLTQACQEGLTLVYDEFTRSRPEANNVLLSVLEERMLVLPIPRGGEAYLKVHTEFASIFTSNPADYAGVHKTQEALLDRMVTIYLSPLDRESEIAITQARSGIPRRDAEGVVDLVRALRERDGAGFASSVRSCIMIGKVLQLRQAQVSAADPIFRQTCLDVLLGPLLQRADGNRDASLAKETLLELMEEFCTTKD